MLSSRGRMVSGATWFHHRGMEAAVHSTSVTRCVCVPTMETGAGWVWPEGGSLLTLPQVTVRLPGCLPSSLLRTFQVEKLFQKLWGGPEQQIHTETSQHS